jgi:hypothetical protein
VGVVLVPVPVPVPEPLLEEPEPLKESPPHPASNIVTADTAAIDKSLCMSHPQFETNRSSGRSVNVDSLTDDLRCHEDQQLILVVDLRLQLEQRAQHRVSRMPPRTTV